MIALAAVFIAGGIAVSVWAFQARANRQVRNLRGVLDMAYDGKGEELSSGELSQLLARAGAVAERALEGTGLAGKIVSKVERSDWQVGPGEFVSVTVIAAAAGVSFGFLAGGPALAVLLGIVGLVAPTAYVNRSVEKRRKKFEEQFPGILDLIAAGLESGGSMAQALELVVAEADDPAATEFSRVLSATRLGVPLVDAMRAMAERVGSRDLDWTVQAIVVQQRTGGKLADILHTVAEFMRGREEIRREVDALTAEGRLSAYILGGLPFVIAGVLLVVNPDYLDPLFNTMHGWVMLGGSLLLLVVGFIVMFRMIKIEV